MNSSSLLTIVGFFVASFFFSNMALAQKRVIQIPDDIFLSSAQLVANERVIGILDGTQKQFLLFDHDSGDFLTKIDARDSFPGFNWFPIRPKLLQNEVFFTNSAPWGVYIDYQNEVTHVAERTFLATGAYDFIHDSLYVGFFTQPNGDYELRGVNRDGNPVVEFEEFELEFPNLSYRSEELNHVLFHNSKVYFLPAYTTTAYEFDQNGKLLRTLPVNIDGFKKVDRDKRKIEPGNMSALMQEMIRVTKGKSSIAEVYALNASELLLISQLGYEIDEKHISLTKLNLQTGKSETKLVERSDYPSFARNNMIYLVDIESEPATITIESLQNYWKR